MTSIMYGYARVSTRSQKEDRQLAALKDFGVAEERITIEKQSGKNFDRPRSVPETFWSSRASTVLAGTMMRFWNNGPISQKPSERPLSYWTCPCWTPGRAGT